MLPVKPPHRFSPHRHPIAMLVCVFGLTVVASGNEPSVEPAPVTVHPLAATLETAQSYADHIRATVRDYSCRLVKRERIRGEMQEYQFMAIQVRCGIPAGDEASADPMSVFIRYLAPGHLKGRRALYIEGENNGKVLVRKGGRSFGYIRVEIDPDGSIAKNESNYPITDIGFDRIIARLIKIIEDDIEADPEGDNTEVSQYKNAKVKDRVCTHFRVTHPRREDGLAFHQANLYIDDEHRVPLRLTVKDWPEQDGGEPVLKEEYTYIDLKLNTGLTDDVFATSRLDDSRDRATVPTKEAAARSSQISVAR